MLVDAGSGGWWPVAHFLVLSLSARMVLEGRETGHPLCLTRGDAAEASGHGAPCAAEDPCAHEGARIGSRHVWCAPWLDVEWRKGFTFTAHTHSGRGINAGQGNVRARFLWPHGQALSTETKKSTAAVVGALTRLARFIDATGCSVGRSGGVVVTTSRFATSNASDGSGRRAPPTTGAHPQA